MTSADEQALLEHIEKQEDQIDDLKRGLRELTTELRLSEAARNQLSERLSFLHEDLLDLQGQLLLNGNIACASIFDLERQAGGILCFWCNVSLGDDKEEIKKHVSYCRQQALAVPEPEVATGAMTAAPGTPEETVAPPPEVRVKCPECVEGRYCDPSHSSMRRCEKCEGKGFIMGVAS